MSSNVRLAGIACLKLINNAPISVSAADDITLLMILATFKTAPLSCEFSLFDDTKNVPQLDS